ncbi:MAG: zf-HC2 domain-containing protein [SAR324 cluster bacterium]|nr:zf-HC2 domain-containing protein [SAR324 cluster bacterium]
MNPLIAQKQKCDCQELHLLLSQALDENLDRAQIVNILEHLAECMECYHYLQETIQVENLSSLVQQDYFQPEASAELWNRIQSQIPQTNLQKSSVVQKNWREVINWFNHPVRLKITRFAGLSGVGIAIVFSVLFWPENLSYKNDPHRLVVHEIPIQNAADSVTWNSSHTVFPAHELKVKVNHAAAHPFYFRVSSPDNAVVSFRHQHPDYKYSPPHQLLFKGIRYVTLENPREQDSLSIYNQGQQPVSVNAYTIDSDTEDLFDTDQNFFK